MNHEPTSTEPQRTEYEAPELTVVATVAEATLGTIEAGGDNVVFQS